MSEQILGKSEAILEANWGNLDSKACTMSNQCNGAAKTMVLNAYAIKMTAKFFEAENTWLKSIGYNAAEAPDVDGSLNKRASELNVDADSLAAASKLAEQALSENYPRLVAMSDESDDPQATKLGYAKLMFAKLRDSDKDFFDSVEFNLAA